MFTIKREEVFFIMEPIYKYFKPAWRSFYKLIILQVLILILACVGSFIGPCKSGTNLFKWMWIFAVVVDVLIFCYIAIQRATTSLVLRDNPDKAEDQEVAFIVCHPLKPFSSDFRTSIEIGLANIMHIKVGQTMMQTVLNIGDIVVTSSGTATEEIFAPNIPNPQAVRDEIQVHARRYTMPASTPSTPTATPTAEGQQA